MIYELYAIYDNATHRYSQPMCFENLDTAKRQIRVTSSIDKTIACCPDDFSLCYLGIYNTTTGSVSADVPASRLSIAEILREGDKNEVQ